MAVRKREEYTVTLSTQGHEPATISGNLFGQVAHSFGTPKRPCRACGGTKFGKTKHGYWICMKCGQLSAWKRGDDKR